MSPYAVHQERDRLDGKKRVYRIKDFDHPGTRRPK